MSGVSRKVWLTGSVAALLCGMSAGAYFGAKTAAAKFKEAQENFYRRAATFERSVIEQVSIFEDYADGDVEKKLRRYLQTDHMKSARLSAKLGKYEPLAGDEEITAAVKSGILVEAPGGRDELYYYYNVPATHRYLRPQARKALELIAGRLGEKINAFGADGVIKLAVSSALRTSGYQESVRKKNHNAVVESTHSYGVSFDLFYEDYYVSLPETEPFFMSGFYDESLEKLRVKHGFLLGDALRRQLHTLLHQVLVELQDEGVLYAILEKRQKCYHITALP